MNYPTVFSFHCILSFFETIPWISIDLGESDNIKILVPEVQLWQNAFVLFLSLFSIDNQNSENPIHSLEHIRITNKYQKPEYYVVRKKLLFCNDLFKVVNLLFAEDDNIDSIYLLPGEKIALFFTFHFLFLILISVLDYPCSNKCILSSLSIC